MSLIKKRDVKDSQPEQPRRNILIFKSPTSTGVEASPADATRKFYEVIPISPAPSAVREDATGTTGSSKKPR